ncbi:MAG: glycosyltransferase family 4 protein [Acidimicrobiia bacterium]|nr:glycosyltransferase family 4 protein [Acidimicrobiia bacterium]MYC45235.1 glycosyltransferase family 4 protein [Acidimicrobiia bacterium]MYI19503.1 glycosyltransferase family 4 protein [Acidimicrobiia bacterium]
MATCAILSFRLGLSDGVSVVAGRWGTILQRLGHRVVTVAGEGPVDRKLEALATGAPEAPGADELSAALADAELVIVENLCTIPLNLPAARVAAAALAGRPAVLHHHDPPWQRQRFAHVTELPPDDPAWRHVTINRLTEHQMAARGISATTIYNPFEVDAPPGDRAGTRRLLDVAEDELLFAHPVRAIPRKDIPRALQVCEDLGATYWLTGPTEEGYEPALKALLAEAACRILRHPVPSAADIYAAADAVVFTSTWEGFGNPPVEAAVHGRPAIVSQYPVAAELRALGFRWFDPDDLDPLRAHLAGADPQLADQNRWIVQEHLSMEVIGNQIADLLADMGIHA